MSNTTKWVCTDPDTRQYRKEIIPNHTYEFKELRKYPKETKTPPDHFSKSMCIDDYTQEEINDALESYGYDLDDKEITSDIPLILECLFELEN